VRVTLVAGMPRQGKTTLALAVARKEAKRLLVLDPTRSTVMATVQGVPNWPTLSQWLVTPGAASNRWAVALRSGDPADYVELLRHLKYLRHTTVLVDEALTFTSDADALPQLIKAARTGAHYGDGTGLNLILTAQRPVDLPRDMRAVITRLYIFQTREPGDLEWIAKYTQQPELAERVAGLAPHHFVEYPATDTRRPHDERLFHGRARSGGAADAVPARPPSERDQQVSGVDQAQGLTGSPITSTTTRQE
jgi:hypothetical protein